MRKYLTWLDEVVYEHMLTSSFFSGYNDVEEITIKAMEWAKLQKYKDERHFFWFLLVGHLIGIKNLPDDKANHYNTMVTFILALIPFVDYDKKFYVGFMNKIVYDYDEAHGIKIEDHTAQEFAQRPVVINDDFMKLIDGVYYIDCNYRYGDLLVRAIFLTDVSVGDSSLDTMFISMAMEHKGQNVSACWSLSDSFSEQDLGEGHAIPKVSDLGFRGEKPSSFNDNDFYNVMLFGERIAINTIIFREAAKNTKIRVAKKLPQIDSDKIPKKRHKARKALKLKTLFSIETLETRVYETNSSLTRKGSRREPDSRVFVRAHPRWQPIGKGRKDRKAILVKNHERYKDKPIKPRLGCLRQSVVEINKGKSR